MESAIVGKLVVGLLFALLLIGAQWVGKAVGKSLKESAKELNERAPK